MFTRLLRRGRWAALLIVLLPLSGCAKWNEWMLPDEGFNDGTSGWTRNLRPKSDIGQTGLSARSREIERNLGVE